MKELNVLKFYGILLVVLGHVTAVYCPGHVITTAVPSDLLRAVKEVIYTFHMPLFIFASGCIFAYQLEVKKKQMTFLSLLANKAKRLMIPFFAFALLTVWPTMVLLGFRDPVHYLIDGFILAFDPRHLWFVYALFLIFLLFYVLRRACLRLRLPVWAIAVVALLLYCFPLDIAYFQAKNVQTYLVWFTLGYLFTLYKPVAKYVALVALCTTVLGVLTEGVLPSPIASLAYAITGIAACYVLSVHTMRVEQTRLYRWVAPNSFGVYLFHGMIIYWLYAAAAPYAVHPLLLASAVFVVSLSLSVVLTRGVRALGWGVIIGERAKKTPDGAAAPAK